jgi:RNA polymerase sigma-70 factor (ECF subfamily)
MPLLREDPALLDAFRRGERDALARVYWAYIERVERVVRYGYAVAARGVRVPGAGRQEIVDLVQEAFARAFAPGARAAYDGDRDYGAYLATIARHVLVDWARKRGREVTVDAVPDSPDEAAPEAEPWADPATMKVVEEYLASIDEPLRSVHRERYERGLSQEAAARALGLSRQQLRTREARLREGLARALATARACSVAFLQPGSRHLRTER